MKNNMRIALVAIIAMASQLRAVTIDVGTSFLVLSNAVQNVAREGDIVQCGAGTIPFTGSIIIDRNISFTIRGAGTNLTTLVSAGAPIPLWIRSNSTNVFTVSDFNVVGAASDISGFIVTGPNPGSATPMRGPLHLYNLRMASVLNRGISMGGGDSFGLIDHCYFETITNVNFTHVSFFGNDYYSWAKPSPLGSSNVVCVEDCVFKSHGLKGNGFFDAYNGAQMVMRHNVFEGSANSGAHGYDSSVTGVRTGEIYSNSWINVDATAVIIDWRSGVLLHYGNRVSAAPGITGSQINPLLKLYRACDGVVPTVINYANIPQVVTLGSNPLDGQSFQLIYQPNYVFKSSITGGNNLNRYVKIGATIAESVSNLVSCINVDPAGAGSRYAAATVTHPEGRNWDVQVISFNATSCTLSNLQDGNGPFSWPASQQHGVIQMMRGTSAGVVRFPCYSWDNKINGVNYGFGLGFDTSACNGHNNVTNLLQAGRDYFMDTEAHWAGPPVGYAPLIYPHPLNTISQIPESGGGESETATSGGGAGTISFTNVITLQKNVRAKGKVKFKIP